MTQFAAENKRQPKRRDKLIYLHFRTSSLADLSSRWPLGVDAYFEEESLIFKNGYKLKHL